jgi:hypothetical protein
VEEHGLFLVVVVVMDEEESLARMWRWLCWIFK